MAEIDRNAVASVGVSGRRFLVDLWEYLSADPVSTYAIFLKPVRRINLNFFHESSHELPPLLFNPFLSTSTLRSIGNREKEFELELEGIGGIPICFYRVLLVLFDFEFRFTAAGS